MPNSVRTEQEYLVRLLAAAQRFPWAGAALAAYVSLSVLALPLPLLGLRFDGPPATRAALAVLGASFAAHLVAQAPAWIERAAALVLGNLVALAAMLTETLGRETEKVLLVVIVTAAGVAWSLLVPCRPPRARGVYAAELLAIATLAWVVSAPPVVNSTDTGLALAFLLALPVVFGAVVGSPGSAMARVAWTTTLGVALGAAHLVSRRPQTPLQAAEILGGAALVGATVGVLAAVARMARSFTVLPRDHPSLTDFAAGRPRESR